MKKYLILLTSGLLLAACSNDLADRLAGADDLMNGYEGPVSVKIGIKGSNVTRTTNDFITGPDAYFGNHPFPRAKFETNDAVGILHVLERNGAYEVTNFKAVTTDGGQNWTVKDMQGSDAIIRCYGKGGDRYFAYTPYKEGGLNESDYVLSVLADANATAYDFFKPLVDATRAAHDNQSTAEGFAACDLLGAEGTCTANPDGKTASLEIELDHLQALNIVKLAKWEGKVIVYGCYDTWVAPDQTIWRMKQRLQPVVATAFDGEVTPKSDGILDTWFKYDADTCYFYMKLVEPNVEKKRFGNADLAKNGGWLVDIPAVPSGQYVLTGMPYYRYFRAKGFDPTEDNIAGQTWYKEWEQYYKSLMPYTWTYEDILFDNSDVNYDYDEIMEIGDQLLADGNVSKSGTGIGTVKWIAYAPQPWLETLDYARVRPSFFLRYINNPTLFADNGYRAKGKEIETNGKKHLSVDYAGHGYSSLDGFWQTEICNHFLAMYNSDVTYKSSSSDILHDDEIFSLLQPVISYNTEQGMYKQTSSLFGYDPSTWAYMSTTWHANADGETGIRSNKTAGSANGPSDEIYGSSWMVPTTAQYFLGNYADDQDNDYLTCNHLPTWGYGIEGIASIRDIYSYDFSYDDFNFNEGMYFGLGCVRFVEYGFSFNFRNFSSMPLASTDMTITVDTDGFPLVEPLNIEKDHLYIINKVSLQKSVIDPPTLYRPCIIY